MSTKELRKKDKVFKGRKRLGQDNHKQKRLFQAGRVTCFLFLQWLSGKESACNEGDSGEAGSIPGLGRSPGGGHGNPFQYSCLENPKDREAWWVTVHRVAKSWT